MIYPTGDTRDQNQCLDLSRISDQNKRISMERMSNLSAIVEVEQDDPVDSSFRHLIDEVTCVSNYTELFSYLNFNFVILECCH